METGHTTHWYQATQIYSYTNFENIRDIVKILIEVSVTNNEMQSYKKLSTIEVG